MPYNRKKYNYVANFEGRDTKIGGNVGSTFAKRRAKGFFKIPKGTFFKAI